MTTGSLARCAAFSSMFVTLALGLFSAAFADQKPPITVFAAASLKNALDDIATTYQKQTGETVIVSYGASSALAKQIESGAPADIFISADTEWMDDLKSKSLIQPGTGTALIGNTLVLIAPAASSVTLTIEKNFALAAALGDGRLAAGGVKAVPAGRYAKAALENLGVWASVSEKLAETENVRAALALVARGEAPLGIVYLTDAVAEPKVKVVATFPEDTHPPIIYALGITKDAQNAEAAGRFVKVLAGPEAKARFAKEGFKPLQ